MSQDSIAAITTLIIMVVVLTYRTRQPKKP